MSWVRGPVVRANDAPTSNVTTAIASSAATTAAAAEAYADAAVAPIDERTTDLEAEAVRAAEFAAIASANAAAIALAQRRRERVSLVDRRGSTGERGRSR